MKKRREYSPEYKAKLVIEVLREEHTLSGIASRENINGKQLSNWKSEFLENAARVFSRNREEKTAAQQAEDTKERERNYQAKVGQLTLEVDFLKEACNKVYGSGWEDITGFQK